ncbi:hypothetical protein KF840_13640 [bacterium]|nr:hypothetical protein [bacterium]
MAALSALAEALIEMDPAAIGDEQVRALAREILSREPYATWHGSDDPLWWLHHVSDWLERWNDWVGALPAASQVLIIAGLLAVSALLLTHVVWSVAAALRAPRSDAAPPATDAAPSFAAEAEALAAQGRFLDAAHRLQLATIALLVSQRRLALSRFEANRVLRRRVREAALPSAERRTLLDLLDRLERGWFRDRAGDADLYGAWRALHARLAGGGGEA